MPSPPQKKEIPQSDLTNMEEETLRALDIATDAADATEGQDNLGFTMSSENLTDNTPANDDEPKSQDSSSSLEKESSGSEDVVVKKDEDEPIKVADDPSPSSTSNNVSDEGATHNGSLPPKDEPLSESKSKKVSVVENGFKSQNLPSVLTPNGITGDDDDKSNDKPKTIWTKDKDGGEGGGEGGDEDGRDTWDNPLEFLLSCISMSVGLGNVWRFPFVAYSNGGGAFLIPYLIVLLLIGRPIYYLEMCLGQFSRFGQVKVWNMAPMFKGVGYGSMVGTICVVSFYCSIMAQTVFYFFSSFAKNLPWSVCNKDWGGDLCFNETHTNPAYTNDSITSLFYALEAFPVKPQIDDGIGSPEWRLSLCLLFSWVLVFLSLVKGVKSSGKVAYFTAIFPYVVMIILLIRGVTLPGAGDGILYFITPQWDKLYKPEVWYEAVGQCFFSLSTGFGPIIMFSSYNPFRHNVARDALIISFMDTFTSLLAGCTIFAVLGYLKETTGAESIDDVTPGGPGLAFVSYPEAIAQFGWAPQFFAVLFFLMLFTLGIGSATSLAGGIITIICDQFPNWKRWVVTLTVCIVGFFAGLIYVTPGGNFMVDLVNEYGANFVIYVMAMIEVFAVSWIYGLENFCRDIEFMLGIKVGWYWRFCWGYFIPIGLLGILGYTLGTQEEFKSGGVSYPTSAIVMGWLLAASAIALLPIMGLHGILTRKETTFWEKFKAALKPTKHWGPQNPQLRREWEDFKANYDDNYH